MTILDPQLPGLTSVCVYRSVTGNYALNTMHTTMVKFWVTCLLIPESKSSIALVNFPNLGLKMVSRDLGRFYIKFYI